MICLGVAELWAKNHYTRSYGFLLVGVVAVALGPTLIRRLSPLFERVVLVAVGLLTVLVVIEAVHVIQWVQFNNQVVQLD